MLVDLHVLLFQVCRNVTHWNTCVTTSMVCCSHLESEITDRFNFKLFRSTSTDTGASSLILSSLAAFLEATSAPDYVGSYWWTHGHRSERKQSKNDQREHTQNILIVSKHTCCTMKLTDTPVKFFQAKSITSRKRVLLQVVCRKTHCLTQQTCVIAQGQIKDRSVPCQNAATYILSSNNS